MIELSVKHTGIKEFRKEEFAVICPRCGEPMSGGICDNCGFPMRRIRKIIPLGTVRNMSWTRWSKRLV